MYTFFHKAGANPRIAGYIASALSIAFCLAIAGWGLSSSFDFRQSVSSTRFQEELQRRDFISARRTIGLLADPKSLDAQWAANDDISARKEKLKQATWDLISVAENLKPERLNAATAAYQRADRNLDTLKLNTGKESLDLAFEACSKALEDLRESDQVIEELKKEAKSWAEEYGEIAGRFSRLVSIAAEAREPDANKPLSFYSSGILAGLPKLVKIQDDLPDLIAFRDEMVKAGGRVNLEGNDVASLFQIELDDLKSSSSKVSQGHANVLENIRKALLRKREAQEDLKSLEDRLITEITRFAVSRWEKTAS